MKDRETYNRRLYHALQKVTNLLHHAQERYKREFARLRKTRVLHAGEAAFLHISDPGKKMDKISHNMSGTFKILDMKQRTTLIKRGDVSELVSLYHVGCTLTTTQTVNHDNDATPKKVAAKKQTV